MDYVAKINAAILAFKLMAETEIDEIKEGIKKQLLSDDNDLFLDLLDMYQDDALSAEGLKKPEAFREVDRLQRLTNFVEMKSFIRKAREAKKEVSADKLNYILRNVDEAEWNVYHAILSKKADLFAAPKPEAKEEVQSEKSVQAADAVEQKKPVQQKKRKSSNRNK